jgi:hypothetical protein
MPPDLDRPGENPADIVDGARKRKATECSIVAKPHVESKRARLAIATGKKRPVAKRTTTTVVKSTVVLKKSRKFKFHGK